MNKLFLGSESTWQLKCSRNNSLGLLALTFLPFASRSQLRCFDCFEGRFSSSVTAVPYVAGGTAVKLHLVRSLCACLRVSDTVWQQHSFPCTQGALLAFIRLTYKYVPYTYLCCLCTASIQHEIYCICIQKQFHLHLCCSFLLLFFFFTQKDWISKLLLTYNEI